MLSIFGLGLQEKHWKTVFSALQKALPRLEMKARVLSREEVKPENLLSTSEKIAKAPPHLFLFSPRAFQASQDCVFFLKQLQASIPQQQCQFGVVVENVTLDVEPFLSHGPKFRMLNQMELRVTALEMILTQPLSKFPRIRVDEHLSSLVYKDRFRKTQHHALHGIPKDSLIAAKDIQMVHTAEGKSNWDKWLAALIKNSKKNVEVDLVQGLLREEQGCYLFPGIPIDRTQRMVVEDCRVDYFLLLDSLNLRSPSYKRLVEFYLEFENVPKAFKSQRSRGKVRLLSQDSLLNHILGMLFQEHRWEKPLHVERLPAGEHELDKTLLWIQLTDMPKVAFRGKPWDWRKPLQKIMQPLHAFVEWSSLHYPTELNFTEMSLNEWKQARDDFNKREKQLTKEHRQAQNKLLLLEQEESILRKNHEAYQEMLQYLENALTWSEAMQQAKTLQAAKLLILSDDQDQVTELYQSLQRISKKLWINPVEDDDSEALKQLKPSTLKSYAEKGLIILSAVVREDLHDKSLTAEDRLTDVVQERMSQQEWLEQSQLALDTLRREKEDLALRWLTTCLRKFLIEQQDELQKRLKELM